MTANRRFFLVALGGAGLLIALIGSALRNPTAESQSAEPSPSGIRVPGKGASEIIGIKSPPASDRLAGIKVLGFSRPEAIGVIPPGWDVRPDVRYETASDAGAVTLRLPLNRIVPADGAIYLISRAGSENDVESMLESQAQTSRVWADGFRELATVLESVLEKNGYDVVWKPSDQRFGQK